MEEKYERKRIAKITTRVDRPCITLPSRKRVVAYARVSVDTQELMQSLSAQVSHYSSHIQANPSWKYTGVYADAGISGAGINRRAEFQRLSADRNAGRIDIILTKSNSRFARNTVDSLTTIRMLKDKKVEVYFEKENIWTFDSKGELLITIMSSLAQEESRSISENVKWGRRKRFADGQVTVPFSRFLGYDKGPDGNLMINVEQAKLVRYIFTLNLQGLSPNAIANRMENEGYKDSDRQDSLAFHNRLYRLRVFLSRNPLRGIPVQRVVAIPPLTDHETRVVPQCNL